MRSFPPILLLALFFLTHCKQEEKEVYSGSAAYEECKKTPAFVAQIGYNPQMSGFSTSERKVKGLTYVQFAENPDDKKIYQHPSWKQYGSMGPMVLDELGNIYVAPVPVVNVLENKPEQQNIVYKVDAATQEMKTLLEIPATRKPTPENPYGILGLAYDCRSRLAFASTVMGSDRENELGLLCSFDLKTGKIIDKAEGIDAMGVGVNFLNQKNRLFFGKARTSEIWSVEVDKEGKFVGQARMEIVLEGLGPRGDDKARKIRFLPNGDMQVQAINFYFNLTAPTEKQETVYVFRYDTTQAKWVLVEVK